MAQRKSWLVLQIPNLFSVLPYYQTCFSQQAHQLSICRTRSKLSKRLREKFTSNYLLEKQKEEKEKQKINRLNQLKEQIEDSEYEFPDSPKRFSKYNRQFQNLHQQQSADGMDNMSTSNKLPQKDVPKARTRNDDNSETYSEDALHFMAQQATQNRFRNCKNQRQVEEILDTSSEELSPTEIAMTFNLLGKFASSRNIQRNLLLRMEALVLKHLENMKAWELALVFHSCHKTRFRKFDLFDKLAKRLMQPEIQRQLNLRTISMVYLSCANMNYKNPSLFDSLGPPLLLLMQQRRVSSQNICNLLFAFARLKFLNIDVIHQFSKQLSRPDVIDDLKQLDFANIICSLGTLQHQDEKLLQDFFEEMKKKNIVKQYTQRHFVQTFHGLSEFRRCEVTDKLSRLILKELLSRNFAPIVDEPDLDIRIDANSVSFLAFLVGKTGYSGDLLEDFMWKICQSLQKREFLEVLGRKQIAMLFQGLSDAKYYNKNFMNKLLTQLAEISHEEPEAHLTIRAVLLSCANFNFPLPDNLLSNYMQIIKDNQKAMRTTHMCEVLWSLAVLDILTIEYFSEFLVKLQNINSIENFAMIGEVILYLQLNALNSDQMNKQLASNPDIIELSNKAMQCLKLVVKQRRSSPHVQDINQILQQMGIESGSRVQIAKGYVGVDIIIGGLGQIILGTDKIINKQQQVNTCLLVHDSSRYYLNESNILVGEYQFRNKLLGKLGWEVFEVSAREWEELQTTKKQQEFLRMRLKLNNRVQVNQNQENDVDNREVTIGN